MDYKDAFNVLEIDFNKIKYKDLTLDYLKKKYKTMALKHHPDKNGNTFESNERFKKINEAYNYLKRELKYLKPEDFYCESEEDNLDDQFIYLNVLKNFIKSSFETNIAWAESKYMDLFVKIISDILNTSKKISFKIFEDLDKDKVLNIYRFLSKYKTILHLSNELLKEIREILLHKYDNVQIYKLNPSINDLINANVYKLYIEEQLFLVPLWHNESYFDGSGCEIIAICEPELPENIKIDDENNLIIDLKLYSDSDLPKMILNNDPIIFNIADESYSIPISELHIKKEQYYYFKGKGLVNIKNDICDISDRSDLFVRITFI
jgi:curved DNA-binding protein CbpA